MYIIIPPTDVYSRCRNSFSLVPVILAGREANYLLNKPDIEGVVKCTMRVAPGTPLITE